MKNLQLIAIFVITAGLVNGQQIVTGHVFDSRNEALVGVNISEKGTLNGTATDLDGNFTLEVATSSAILVFSYTGFTTQEIPLEGKSSLSVTMIEG